jgi:hypothetical protein
MHRITKKLMILPFVLSAVVVDFNGCWRPITSALSWVGVDVSTDDDTIHVDLWGSGHDHDED